jgi:hypothetical protein
MDNKTSKVIKYFQTEELSKIDFKTEDTAILIFFLITLFWRIPKNDYATDDILNRSTINAKGIDPEVLRSDPTYRKLNRANLFMHTIEEMKNFGKKGNRWSNIHQNENSLYVIGDFPFLFKEQPNTFRSFNDTDILFAVSSKRIYSSTHENLKNFATINSFTYNASIIHPIRKVCCMW